MVKLFLLFLTELLESGIAGQRIPERIEPKILIGSERKRVELKRRSVSRIVGYRVENRS